MNLRPVAALPALALTLLALAPAHAEGHRPVLGSPHHLHHGSGFGTPYPDEIDNGGDPSGHVVSLTWKNWGEATTTARGETSILKPQGGYYDHSGRIILRASALGTCPDGTVGYTRLDYRVQRTPDGPIGKKWHPWAGTGDIC